MMTRAVTMTAFLSLLPVSGRDDFEMCNASKSIHIGLFLRPLLEVYLLRLRCGVISCNKKRPTGRIETRR